MRTWEIFYLGKLHSRQVETQSHGLYTYIDPAPSLEDPGPSRQAQGRCRGGAEHRQLEKPFISFWPSPPARANRVPV